jgi:hypothetical protein
MHADYEITGRIKYVVSGILNKAFYKELGVGTQHTICLSSSYTVFMSLHDVQDFSLRKI